MPATLTPPAAPATVSPAEYVRNLSPEDQERALVALLKEAIRVHGGLGIIPIVTDTERLGYYVPPAAADEQLQRLIAHIPPEREAEMRRAMATPEDSVSFEEMKAWLLSGEPVPGR